MRKKTIDQRLQELQTDVKKILEILSQGAKSVSFDTPGIDQETIINIKEAADFLQMGRDAIIEKCQKGEIPYVKQGKLMKIKRMDLIEWIRNKNEAEEGSIDDYVNRYLSKHPLKA